MSPARRTLLKRTVLACGGGILASLAGCLGGQVRTGGVTTDETTNTTTSRDDDQSDQASTTDFKQRLPDPTKTPFRNGYGTRYFHVAKIRDRRDDLHENAYQRIKTEMLSASPPSKYIDEDDVDATFKIGFGASVALGSFDPDEFGDRYTSDRRSHGTDSTMTHTTATPRRQPERYAGFDLYGTNRVFAISEDALIEVDTFSDGDPLEYARATIDAQSGETTSYADGNEYVNAMLDLVDEPHVLKCYPETVDGSISRGFRKDVITGGLRAWRFGTDTTHLTFANTYPDPETARNADFEGYIESESARFGAYDGLDVETEGRMVRTEGTIPTAEFDHLSPGGPGDSVHTPNG